MRFVVLLALALLTPALSFAANYDPEKAESPKYNHVDFENALARAQQGDEESQVHLGWMYEQGWGVKKSYPDAAYWYGRSVIPTGEYSPEKYNVERRLSKKQRAAVEQRLMEWCYLPGHFEECLQGRAKQGDVGAQYALGKYLTSEDFGADRHVDGIKWFDDAALQDYPPAAEALGDIASDGRIQYRDPGEAHFWYSLTIDLAGKWKGQELNTQEIINYSRAKLIELEKVMTPAQKENAETRVKNWKMYAHAPCLCAGM
jgi:TPR repeat protein